MVKMKEVYKNKKKKDCPHKQLINKVLSRMVCKLSDMTKTKRKNLNVVLLDGENFGTTKILLKRGLDNNKIHIPNPYIYEKLNKKKLVPIHNLLFKEFIETAKQKYDFLYPDYCCTADGNTDVRPFYDFKKCFELKLFKDVSILATTLASRKNIKATYTGEDFNRVLAAVNKYASENGYIAKLLWNYRYQGMYHMVFGVAIPKNHKILDVLDPFTNH